MKHHLQEISFDTKGAVEFIDLTERVRNIFAESGVRDGQVSVFTRHTTTAIKVNERCERLQHDMTSFLERVVPRAPYRHDEATVDGRANARGHIISLLLGASETVPAAEGRLLLGDWQSIFFVELDGPRRRRSVFVTVTGE
ncbi:MAG TPA: secondary thiamine-phosphate synthase enzyme YjbQ [bacterium]|nr:secondary thiamine-phosphate synthase enzyme YjbQ [bacterium]